MPERDGGTGYPLGHASDLRVHHSMSVGGSALTIGCGLRACPDPLRRLHVRQMIWTLSGWSGPPSEWGTMWSASMLLGLPDCWKSMPMPQMGQFVLPSSSARLMARLLVRCHLAVLVLDIVAPSVRAGVCLRARR